MSNEARHPIFSLLGFFSISFGTAFIGSQGMLRGLGGWYQVLDKPHWSPPAWLFAPCWTVLFVAISVAGWLVWRRSDPSKKVGLALFGLQLALNALWSWLFFGFHLLFASAVEIGVLWVVIGLTTFFFFRIHKWAGILILPWLAWVLFAAALNFSVWRLSQSPSSVEVIQGPTIIAN